MLLLATVVGRRLAGPTPQAVAEPETVVDGDVPSGAPRLTLVNVPREHGP
jgi:hypothetical protein